MADWPTLRNQISEENRQRNEKKEKNPFATQVKQTESLLKLLNGYLSLLDELQRVTVILKLNPDKKFDFFPLLPFIDKIDQ